MKKNDLNHKQGLLKLLEPYSYFLFIVIALCSCGEIKKRTATLSYFYTENKKEALITASEFATLSHKITKFKPNDSLLIGYKTGDSILEKKSPYSIQVPTISANDSLRTIWYKLFYKLNNYKSQLDRDLISSIQEVFMFYEQNATLRNFSGNQRNIIVDTFALNKQVIGRWLTLTKHLDIKLKRRVDFYN